MDPLKIEDVVKIQRDFAARVRRRVADATKLERARPERIIRDQEDQLAQLQAELQAAQQARDGATRRLDADIARKREAIATLQRELEEAKKGLETEQKGSAPKTSTPPAAAPKGKGRPG